MEIGQSVKKTFRPGESGVLAHPLGARVRVREDEPFEHELQLSLAPVDTGSLLLAAGAFRIAATGLGKARVRLSLPLDLAGLEAGPDDEIMAFIEMRDHLGASVVPARLREPTDGVAAAHSELRRAEVKLVAEADAEVVRDQRVRVVGAGAVIVPTGRIPEVFHPVQHHFKMAESRLDHFAPAPGAGGLGPCRRSDSAGSSGTPCESPSSPSLYPACYPAAWAILCGAHRTTAASPRRRWEVGDPHDPNPAPSSSGDPLSTWALGDFDIGATPPPVARVADWRADPADPTPERVRVSALPRFLLDGEGTLAEQVARRAKLIKTYLVRIVGGGYIGTAIPLGADPPRPAKVGHKGHAWVIVGVEPNGYWAHAQNNDAWGFTDFTAWDEAPWAAPKPVFNEHEHPWYEIHYLPDTALKPEDRRLGCIALKESSDSIPRTGFYDLDYPIVYDDVDGDPVDTVLWTPRTRAEETGYTWIESNVPLTREGLPLLRDPDLWDPVFGRVLPAPAMSPEHCTCGLAHGCARCRLRMQLHFWVLNTTRDDRATYRVDLAFWSREARWVEIPARVVTPEHGGTYPARPGPGELFDITATRDLASDPTGVPFLHTAPGRARPWNGQPIEWWIDLERDLLGPDSIHGVRLTLTCVARGDEPICRVQDVKQLWFRVRERGPD